MDEPPVGKADLAGVFRQAPREILAVFFAADGKISF